MSIIIESAFTIVILAIVIAYILLYCAYKKLSQIANETSLSGVEIASLLSNKLTSKEPHIIKKDGKFLDHYNLERNVIKLSPEVFDGTDIYASLIALNIAQETNNTTFCKIDKLTSFLVILSYVIIVICACLTNIKGIYLGMLIFIIAFISEIIISFFLKNIDIEEIIKLLPNKELVNILKEYKDNIYFLKIRNIATLPYRFLNYFR